ncbi:MAG: NUDIX hydrolase [Candidatus Magasanikbacteria bacterium]
MKIPKNAKKVFSGIIFDTYQWQQKMFDGSFQTFEMLDRVDTVQIIPIVGNKIVLVNESQPTLSKMIGVIGGRLEKNEKPIDGAKREMLEETGYSSKKLEKFDEWRPFHKINWTVHRFIARDAKKITEPRLDPGEKIETMLVSFAEFVKIATSENFRSRDITFYLLKLIYQKKLKDFKKKLFSK